MACLETDFNNFIKMTKLRKHRGIYGLTNHFYHYHYYYVFNYVKLSSLIHRDIKKFRLQTTVRWLENSDRVVRYKLQTTVTTREPGAEEETDEFAWVDTNVVFLSWITVGVGEKSPVAGDAWTWNGQGNKSTRGTGKRGRRRCAFLRNLDQRSLGNMPKRVHNVPYIALSGIVFLPFHQRRRHTLLIHLIKERKRERFLAWFN